MSALPALKDPAPAAEAREPFMAFVGDEVTRATLARVAAARGWNEASVLVGGAADAAPALAGIPTPELLVIDLADAGEPLNDLAELAEVCDPGTRVVALGIVNDIALYRELIDSGVEDYLVKPVTADVLGDVLDRRPESLADETTPADSDGGRMGRLIAVVGARGGVGASTVAVNIAWDLAHTHGHKVALVDLDLFFGDIALSLDLEPGRGFLEALENPERIDGLFVQRALVRESDNLFFLGAEETLDRQIAFRAEAMGLLLEQLRSAYDNVVIDLPRFGARTQIPMITPPSSLAVVSDLSLAGMRDSMRLRTFIRETVPDAEVKVVVNRVGYSPKGEMAKADFARGVDAPVDFAIPFDGKAAAESAGRGKPLVQVAPRGKAATALRTLARELGGVDEAAAAPGWRRLLKGGR